MSASTDTNWTVNGAYGPSCGFVPSAICQRTEGRLPAYMRIVRRLSVLGADAGAPALPGVIP